MYRSVASRTSTRPTPTSDARKILAAWTDGGMACWSRHADETRIHASPSHHHLPSDEYWARAWDHSGRSSSMARIVRHPWLPEADDSAEQAWFVGSLSN
jgi:hypothetical protein